MRRLLFVVLGKLTVSLCTLLTLRVYAHELSLTQIGMVTLLQNIDTFFGFVYASSYGNFFAVTALADERKKLLSQKLYEYALLTVGICLIFFPLIKLYTVQFNIGLNAFWLCLFLLFLFFFHVFAMIPSQLTVLDKVELSIALQIVKAVCSVAFVVMGIQFIGGVEGWILGGLIGALLPAIVNLAIWQKKIGWNNIRLFSLRHVVSKQAVFGFLLPFVVLQIAVWIFYNAPRLTATSFFDLRFLGMVGLAFGFGSQFCFAFESVLMQMLQANFYKLIDSDDSKVKMEKFGLFVSVAAPIYLSFFLLGFFPYLLLFRVIVQSEIEISFAVLVFAWIFNCLRIAMNLVGMITQVLSDPKFLLRFILSGLIIGGSLLAFLRGTGVAVSQPIFLGIITLVVYVSFLVTSLKVAKFSGSAMVTWLPILSGVIFLLYGMAGFANFQLTSSNYFIPVAILSIVSCATLAVQVLKLPQKLNFSPIQ